MKHFYLSLIFSLTFQLFFSQNISIPDSNFKNALVVIGIDTNGDGEIQVSEAEATTTLNVSTYNVASIMGIESFEYELTYSITDITGIEHFINLEELDISFNQIENLNISNLVNLKTLLCERNQIDSIDLTSLINLETLDCYQNGLTSLIINANNSLLSLDIGGNRTPNILESNLDKLTNLKILKSASNGISNIDVSALTSLEELDLYNNDLTTLNVTNLTKLKKLTCHYNQLTNLNVSNLVDLENLTCSNNSITNLELGSISKLIRLLCNDNLLATINCSYFSNLDFFDCRNNQITNLDVSNLSKINAIWCQNNQIPQLNVQNLNTLQTLKCSYNNLTSLNISNLEKIEYLDCDNNQLTSLLADNSNVFLIRCDNNKLTNLDFTNTTNLDHLECNDNELTSLYIKNGTNETTFNGSLVTINFENNPNLQQICCDSFELATIQELVNNYGYINCDVSTSCVCSQEILNIPDSNFKSILLANGIDLDNDGEIQVCEAEAVSKLILAKTQPESTIILDLTGLNSFKNLKELDFGWVRFVDGTNLEASPSEFDFTSLSKLEILKLNHAESLRLESINLAGLTSLKTLELVNIRPFNFSEEEENFVNINLTNCESLENLNYYNSFLKIDFCQVPNLKNLDCSYLEGGEPEIFDFSCLGKLENLDISENYIDKLILKNGSVLNSITYNYIGNEIQAYIPFPNYICLDDIQSEYDMMNGLIGPNTTVNSFCSFSPGGDYFSLEGQVKIDIDNNGCLSNTAPFPNLKFKIDNGSSHSIFISNSTGNYSFPLQEGSYTVTPILENEDYLSISPSSLSINFSNDGEIINQDFCLTPNGVKSDIEITIIPLAVARPGFNSYYDLVFKNKGNNVSSGRIELSFDDNELDFLLSTPNTNSVSPNLLSWDYYDLAPLETRTIRLSFNINSPLENPPVNNGDILTFTSTITDPDNDDENESDNIFTLNQIVVNSFDPNDKTCLEGNTITPNLIGEYVHYLIRCENTGTAEAVNIVITDTIDSTKFDINTLIVTSSSHSMFTKINGNNVEFIFENVYLPFDDANNDGYVAFKIKTLPSLQIGDVFENEADIFFDYNAPITTNKTHTSIENSLEIKESLKNEANITLHPNPARNYINIESKDPIKSITVLDLSGRILLTRNYPENKNIIQFSIGGLLDSTYLLTIETSQNKMIKKLIKG